MQWLKNHLSANNFSQQSECHFHGMIWLPITAVFGLPHLGLILAVLESGDDNDDVSIRLTNV